jgi:hypothetical protein
MNQTPLLIVFTCKGTKNMLRNGGTYSWALNRPNAVKCSYVLCTRNSRHKEVEGPEDHGSGFLLARIKDVVLSPFVVPSPSKPDRYLVQFEEYAVVDIPKAWTFGKNPVHYATLEDFGIDPSALEWIPCTPSAAQSPSSAVEPSPEAAGLDFDQAKHGLSIRYGVPPESIEITIRA